MSAFLGAVISWMGSNLAVSIPVVATLLDVILRIIPTPVPMGVLVAAEKIFGQLSSIFGSAESYLSKVLPQNISNPPSPPSA